MITGIEFEFNKFNSFNIFYNLTLIGGTVLKISCSQAVLDGLTKEQAIGI